MRDDLSTLSVGIVSLPFLEPQVTLLSRHASGNAGLRRL